jgi:hypothetical protein
MLSGACAAQYQFNNQPKVQLTGGRVTSFVTGSFQTMAPGTDILFINAATSSGASSSVLVGEHLSPTYDPANSNYITFAGASNVVATVADFDGDGFTDYAFALTQASGSSYTYNLCIYYGTGYISSPANSSYNNGTDSSGYSIYPPSGGTSGCITFPPSVSLLHQPIYSYISALPLTTSSKYPQFLIEDSANGLLYVISNNGSHDFSHTTTNFKVQQTITLPSINAAGPIYTGGYNNNGFANFFNSKGNSYFIVNGQTDGSVTEYVYDNTTGQFAEQAWNTGNSPKVYSMLMQDMDGDGIPDMVVEGSNGGLEILSGYGDGTFNLATEGTFPGGNGLSGNGGHLALISNMDGAGHIEILTTTAMGLSVFENSGSYRKTYTLQGIYNIGPGRTSFALGNSIVQSSGTLDLAVDGPEGITVLPGDGNGDGGFLTSDAFPTYAPALSAVVGQFRNTKNNPTGALDAVVSTEDAGTVQGQLLEGNGSGVFTPAATMINTTTSPSGIPSTLWSNVVAGDFNGDGKLDIAYTLTGSVGSAVNPSLYVQYGNGDGTFQAPVAVNPGVPSGNTFYGASVVGDFNGDGLVDIANIDSAYVDTLLGQNSTTVPFNPGMNQTASGNSLNLIAAGYFKATTSTGITKTSKQDLVTLQGTSLIPYANSGDGKTFTQEPALTDGLTTSGYAVSALLLADVNNDGNGDVIAIYHNLAADPSNPSASTPNYLYIWKGNGDRTFKAPTIVTLDRNFYLAAVADMDNDGFPDLVLSDGYLVGILFNQGDGSFGQSCSYVSHQEQHYLAGQGINAIVPVSLTGDGHLDLVLANGGVTIANPLVLGGVAQTSATLAIDPVVSTGGLTVLMNAITTQPVTGTITVYDSSYPSASSLPLEPSNYTQAFTLVAVVTPVSGTTVPGGTATFYIDGVEPASCTPYSLTVSNLPPGAPANSSATYCQIPSGNTYPVGTHSLTVAYSGDGTYSPLPITGSHLISGGSTTTTLYLCIGPTASCPSTGYVMPPLDPNLGRMVYGQTLNGTVVVTTSPPGGAVPGAVSIYDSLNGSAPTFLCSEPCSLSSNLQIGVNILTAVYAGDSVNSGSTSNAVTVTVSGDTPTVVVSSSLNPAVVGTAVTFTATVSGTYAAPTGTVTFWNGPTQLCTATAPQTLTPSATGVTSTATCTTSTLPIGSDQITASYAATTDFAAATSPAFTETITLGATGNFSVTVAPNPVSLGVGYGSLLSVTVTANTGFTQDVTLSCGNLPSEASCTFTTMSIAGGSGMATMFLNTAAPHTCGTSEPYFVGKNDGGLLPMALPALAGLIAIFIPGRKRIGRRWLRSLLVVLLTAGAMQIAGCSTTCTDLGTKPGTYTFQVLGTAAGTGEVESQTVTLTVTI